MTQKIGDAYHFAAIDKRVRRILQSEWGQILAGIQSRRDLAILADHVEDHDLLGEQTMDARILRLLASGQRQIPYDNKQIQTLQVGKPLFGIGFFWDAITNFSSGEDVYLLSACSTQFVFACSEDSAERVRSHLGAIVFVGWVRSLNEKIGGVWIKDFTLGFLIPGGWIPG